MREKDRVYWLGVTATLFGITFATILFLSVPLGFLGSILFFGTLIVLAQRKITKQKEVIKEQKIIIGDLEKLNSKKGGKKRWK